jgi:hypothetical protein
MGSLGGIYAGVWVFVIDAILSWSGSFGIIGFSFVVLLDEADFSAPDLIVWE